MDYLLYVHYHEACNVKNFRFSEALTKAFLTFYIVLFTDNSRMKLDISASDSSTGSSKMTIPDSASDFNQWLQSMLAVARLPGGLPIEFRRKVDYFKKNF